MISILADMSEIGSYRDTTCIPDHANGFPASLESLGIVYDTAGGFKTDKTRLYAELSKKFQNLSFHDRENLFPGVAGRDIVLGMHWHQPIMILSIQRITVEVPLPFRNTCSRAS